MSQVKYCVAADGHKIAYQVVMGEGREQTRQEQVLPVVLVCGWSSVKEDWSSLPQRLVHSLGSSVVVFDNRGVGQSGHADEFLTLRKMAQDVVALLDHLQFQVVDVVGASMGGFIVQELLMLAPHRVRKAVLGCTSHLGPNAVPVTSEFKKAVMARDEHGKVTKEHIEAIWRLNLSERYQQQHAEELKAFLEEVMTYKRPARGILYQQRAIDDADLRLESELTKIKHPVLIIHGTDDKLIPYQNARLLHKKISHSQLATMKGVGHMFWIEETQKTAQLIASFLQKKNSKL